MPTPQVLIITQGLQIINLQGVAVSDGDIIVSTLNNRLLRVSQSGDVTTLADVSRYGIPFGLVEKDGNFLVTVTGEEIGDRLIRVTKSGFFTQLPIYLLYVVVLAAPLESLRVIILLLLRSLYANRRFIATDISSSAGCLVRVMRNGSQTILADTTAFGTPFAVTASKDGFAVGCENGDILQVNLDGKLTPIVNLVNAGFGIPFNLVEVDTKLIVTTNMGNILQINPDGTISTIVNLSTLGLGIPSGVAVLDDSYIVTTNAGNLLRIT